MFPLKVVKIETADYFFLSNSLTVVTYFSSKLYLSNLQRVYKLRIFRTSIRFTASIFIPAQVTVHVSAIYEGFPKFFLLQIYYVIL